MAKRTTYSDIELEFAEKQLRDWKSYLEANPIDSLKHDIEWKPTKNGGVIPMVIASIQQQGKFLQETLKNYLLLLSEVDKMRQVEEKKKQSTRGDITLGPLEGGEI